MLAWRDGYDPRARCRSDLYWSDRTSNSSRLRLSPLVPRPIPIPPRQHYHLPQPFPLVFSFKSLTRSLRHALRGIVTTAHEEHSFRVQLVAGLAVVVLMWIFQISAAERAILALAVAFVLVLELLNSVVERFVDVVKPRVHHYAMVIKDIMAGAVLISSLGAILVGVAILGPHVISLLQRVL